MLAAGNRVIIKPSEYTPQCGELLKKMLTATFPTDLVAVILGAADVAKEATSMPFDHILYTGMLLISLHHLKKGLLADCVSFLKGSPAVGKIVMAAAAKNLIPVTLELGGKWCDPVQFVLHIGSLILAFT